MHYRLVRLHEGDEYIQIFNETTSELIGSVIKNRRWGIIPRYQLRFIDRIVTINRSILFRRRWKINDSTISLKWRYFGQALKFVKGDAEYQADSFNRGKMTISNAEGRTAVIINLNELKSTDMVIMEDYERIEAYESCALTVVTMDYYKQW